MATFQQTHETVKQSKIFKDFISKNPQTELVAGFFILDFLSNDTKNSLDYKLDEKIITFSVNQDNEVTLVEDKLIEQESNAQPYCKIINKRKIRKMKEVSLSGI